MENLENWGIEFFPHDDDMVNPFRAVPVNTLHVQLDDKHPGDTGYTFSPNYVTPTQYERDRELYMSPWHPALREWVRHGCPTDRNDPKANKFQMPNPINSSKENKVICRFCQTDKFCGQTIACDYCPYTTMLNAAFVDLAAFLNELR